MRPVERAQLGQRRVPRRALQIVTYARQMLQILRLAVAPVEPHENADDLGIALRRHDRIGLVETGAVESRASRLDIGIDDAGFQLLGNRHARVHGE